MLQLSPELLAHLRSTQAAADEKLRQARGPWTPTLKAIPQAQAKRLNGDRRSRLVDIVMTVLKTGEPTHFAFEASCRHGLRGSLCLQGWNWHDADTVAAEIVETALRQIGAQRPTWQQGQRNGPKTACCVSSATIVFAAVPCSPRGIADTAHPCALRLTSMRAPAPPMPRRRMREFTPTMPHGAPSSPSNRARSAATCSDRKGQEIASVPSFAATAATVVL